MQKKIFAVAAFALAFAVAFTASAYDLGSTTLMQGSTGSAVVQLQTALNACNAAGLATDGSFGRGTAAAVKAFQASKLLTADGLVGNATKAALNSCTSMSSGSSTSAAPALCPNGMTLSSNCTASPTATTTVALCPNGMTLASNCSSMPAAGSSTTISGGAGNIQSVITLGSPSSATVSEGDSKDPVLGYEVRADSGSDLKVTNVGVQFQKFSGNGSTWINRYIGNIYVMQGSTVIGSIPSSSLSQNGTMYTANIAVSNSVIPAGTAVDYYIAVDGNTTIDSSDAGSYLQVQLTSLRYNDATGAVLTYSPSVLPNQTFLVQTLADNANVKLQVSEDGNNPHNATITSNYTSNTTDVPLLKFDVTANTSPMYFNEIDVLAQGTGVNDVTQIAQLFKLNYNGSTISTVNFASGLTGSTARVIKFGETSTTNSAIYTATSLNGGSSLVIPAGQTGDFEVLADVKPLATGTGNNAAFDAGDTLTVSLPSTFLLNESSVSTSGTVSGSTPGSNTCTVANEACWSVLDQTGDPIATSTVNREGSASGYAQTFQIQGLSSTLVSSAISNIARSTTGALTSAEVDMNVSITASGSDFYIPRAVGIASSATDVSEVASASDGFVIAALNNAYAYDATTSAHVSGSVNIVSGATIDGTSGRIKISAGQTAVIEVSATITNVSSAFSGAKTIQLNAVGGATDPVSTPTAYATLPAASFQSTQTPAF